MYESKKKENIENMTLTRPILIVEDLARESSSQQRIAKEEGRTKLEVSVRLGRSSKYNKSKQMKRT